MKHPIGLTKNGHSVYVDLIASKAAKQISSQPQLLMHVRQALLSCSPTEDLVEIEHNMGHSVGYDFTVATTEKDIVFYAQLLKSNIYIPFIKNGTPLSTPLVSFIIQKKGTNEYELLNTWIGAMSPGLPSSDNESNDSIAYWSSHAMVYSNQAIQTRSLLKSNPYIQAVAVV